METQEKDYDVIYIPDEEGNDHAFEVLFYFEDPNSGQSYVFLLPEEGSDTEEDEVLAFRYKEEGDQIQLEDVETEAEWDMLDEVFNTLVQEDEEK
ncbi:DUF1292 domain-containing protein [Risungbinella massiliensis]|uniref:DUF1292 domain-containing protein n=1 Tax=Risungbinella massiliensis TaxID=1329796 RepID=UPI0005CBD497|nr:DUF1292 domain-containing protein [Risungbinella massiliensis]